MCENYKAQSIELKRKYDDLQAGLHELGREHQMLQVELLFYFHDNNTIFCIAKNRFKIINKLHLNGLRIVTSTIAINVKSNIQ